MERTRSLVLLVLGLGPAVLAAACGDGGDRTGLSNGSAAVSKGGASKRGPTTSQGTSTTTAPDGTVVELPPGITAKEYFTKNVQPQLAQTCGGCHANGPAPVWIAPQDMEKSYALQFQRGYVSSSSTILHQGVHYNGAGPALTHDETVSYSVWVALELKERGDKAPESVLQKLGGCMSQAKFNAIGWEALVTTPRAADNNPAGETEDADECNGCAQKQCSHCHSADAATGFVMAMGDDLLPADTTFKETRSTKPPYIQKYFGLDTNGGPVASNAIAMKSEATVKTGKAYQHPMFTLTPEMKTAIDAFVDDAIKSYAAGTCAQ